ncbi:MAG: PKD domain-containing protein, partial [Bacteroidota bacterium]
MKRYLLLILFAVPVYLVAQCDSSFTFVLPAGNCPQGQVQFQASADPNQVQNYAWNFGDPASGVNNLSNLAEPTHAFSFPGGNFTVSLTITTNGGDVCTSTQTVSINTVQPLTVSVDTMQKCVFNSADSVFTPTFQIDSSHIGQGPFTWDFGIGPPLISNDLIQTFQYDCYGTYVVTVTASGESCPGYVAPIRFYAELVADLDLIGNSILCEGEMIFAANLSDSLCNNIDYFIWDWGAFGPQYQVANRDTQSFVYNLQGENVCAPPIAGFQDVVSLTAVNGCFANTATVQINIRPLPQAAFTVPDTLCSPATAIFNNGTCPPAAFIGDPTNDLGDFGDPASGLNNTSTLENPVHVYSDTGLFVVTMIASNGCGTDSMQDTIRVLEPPLAVMIPDTNQVCAPVCLNVMNLSTPAFGASYLWEIFPDSISGFNNGDSSSFEPQLCFNGPDTFTVRLTVENFCGVDFTDTTIFVNRSPDIFLDSLPDSCGVFVLDSIGYQINDFGSPISSYSWNFGGGFPATFSGPNPTNIDFSTPGPKSITLTVSNACGNTSASISFDIDALPNVDAGNDTSICVNDTSLNLTATPLPGYWDGIGIDSSGHFLPDTAGLYEVIYVHQALRCLAYDTVLITVVDTPQVTAMNDLGLCEGDSVITLTASPLGGVWTGPNVINGNQFLADSAGTFIFTYSYADSLGCPGRDVVEIEVFPLPQVDISQDTILFCFVNAPQQLPTATPPGGVWSGPGIVNPGSGLFNPNLLGSADTVVVYYTFTTTNGCTDFDSLEVQVVVPGAISAGPGDTACFNQGLDTLGGTNPPGGVWSGTGIIDPALGVYNSLLMTVGPNEVIYTFGAGTSCETSDTTLVIINDTLAVDIGGDLIVCESDAEFTLTASVNGGIWLGQGITDPNLGTFDPALVPAGSTDTVVYTVVHPNGCNSRDIKLITVDDLPQIAFDPVPQACVGDVLTFNNTSSGATTFSWNYGDLSPPTSSNMHTYTAIGTYQITLTGMDANGCADSASQSITISQPPSVFFTQDVDSGCAPLTVNFTDGSNPEGGTYFWDFGNGQTSSLPNPGSVVYQQGTNDTIYTITLTVANSCDTVVMSRTVKVFPQPQILFGTDVSNGCSPLPVNFANASVGQPQDFFWYLDTLAPGNLFSTDSIPPTQILTTDSLPTNYDIILVASNVCGADTDTVQVTVLPNTVTAFFNIDTLSGCVPFTVMLTGLSGAPFIGWDIDNQVQPPLPSFSYTFSAPGTYTIRHFANNGCSFDTTEVDITVLPPPVVGFVPDSNLICRNAPLGFTNTSVGATGYVWDFGDGSMSNQINPTHVFDTSGQIIVSLIAFSDTSACPDTFSLPIQILDLPEASFALSDTAGCPPLTVNLSNAPTGLFYFWDFGDGSGPSTLAGPSHTYDTTGIYTLSLTTTNGAGCSNDTSATVRIYAVPQTDFSIPFDSVCGANTPIPFTNLTTGNLVSCQWNFGDGNVSSQPNPVHQYDSTGTFVVQLVCTNAFGCSQSLSQTITILPQPIANVSANPVQGCAPLPVNFTNLSQNASAQSWLIDGQIFFQNNPAYTFTGLDTSYTVVLRVDTAGFCFDTTSVNIDVASPPVSAFVVDQDQLCFPDNSVQFTDQSSASLPLSYQWDFGDGSPLSAQVSPAHSYALPGEYEVVQTITNSYGCIDSSRDTIFVYPTPVASLIADSTQGCVPFSTMFTQNATNASNYLWAIDLTQDTLIGNSISYTFVIPDTTYLVSLIVDTAGFCFDTTSIQIQTASEPIGAFTVDQDRLCFPDNSVQFTDQSSASLPLNYQWDFGDGSPLSAQISPAHSYAQPGEYEVVQTITNSFGCTDVSRDTIFIYPSPVASLIADSIQGCVPFSTVFTQNATDASNYLWAIDLTQDTLSGSSISYTFTIPDTTYLISLIADTAGFCFDTASVQIAVASPPVNLFGFDPAENCGTPAPVQFTDASQSTRPLSHFWDFGDNAPVSSLTNPLHVYQTTGSFTVQHIIENDLGCMDTLTDVVQVYPQPEAVFTASPDQGCSPLTVSFANQSSNFGQVQWQFGDGGVSADVNPSHTYFATDT